MIIVIRGDLQNKEIIGYTWYPTEPMMTLNCLLAYSSKHKSRVLQVYLIGSYLQANVKHRVFMKLDSRYAEYFLYYSNYFGRPLILKKSMYGMNNSVDIFYDELINWMIDQSGFKQ